MLLIILVQGCGSNGPHLEEVCFEDHVVPLVRQDCASCHWEGEFGIRLRGLPEDHAEIIRYVNVEAPEGSPLLLYASGFGEHSPDWPRGSEEWDLVSRWIGAGAPPRCGPGDTGDPADGSCEDDSSCPVSFALDITPMHASDCASCHSRGQYGVSITGQTSDYSEVMRYVDPEDPTASDGWLWWASGGGRHPRTWPEGGQSYETFLRWVNEGALNN